jgi:hypothetical protein
MKTYIGTKIIKATIPDQGDPARDKAKDGYKVIYPDGYESWSPREVFEEAYTPLDKMNFGHAIVMLKLGKNVARSGWNGKGMWLALQVPDAHSKMTLPYIYLNYPNDAENTPGARVPWLASQTDVLAEDWCVIEGAN